jgi:hypothetical protein
MHAAQNETLIPAPELDAARATRFVRRTLLAALAVLGSIAAFNYAVDPFQQYRIGKDHRYFPALQRYINPGLAKNADYELMVTGSSMMENFSNAAIGRACNARAINLAFSAISGYEERLIADTAIAAGKAKRVVMSLDYNSFSGPPDEPLAGIKAPPLYLFDRQPFNDVYYLLNRNVLAHSAIHAFGLEPTFARHNKNADQPWHWANEYQFSAASTTLRIDPDNINRDFKQPARDLNRMQANFEANIARLAERHPNVEFNFVYPPYSALVWADFAQRKQVDVTLAFKSYVFDRVGRLPNVRVYDFQADTSLVTDLSRYKDIYHYDPAANQMMIEAVCGDSRSHRVTADNVKEINERLRRLAYDTNPRLLVSQGR